MSEAKKYEMTAAELIDYATGVALEVLKREHAAIGSKLPVGTSASGLLAANLDRAYGRKFCHAFAVDMLEDRLGESTQELHIP